jgi:hypothetical protein
MPGPELARVARPGGRVGIFDLDGDGVVLAHPDRALTRRIVAASAGHLIVDGWLVRQHLRVHRDEVVKA